MRFHNRFYVLAVGGVISVLLTFQLVGSALAQTTNITVLGGTSKQQSGNTTNITSITRPSARTLSGGTVSGPNVFFSFGRFDLAAGDIANFVRPDIATTAISVVTGGVGSNINGMIQASGWNNFFFFNPSGITFGSSARLNVSGSAYFSTAQSVKLGNTSFPIQSIPSSEGLLPFSVASFGFSGSPQPITITGNTLTVASGKTLAVIGGPVTITEAQLKAPNGTVQVASVGYGGEVTIAKSFTFTNVSYGGQVETGFTPTFEATGLPGSITMNPGNSFATLDAGPNGTVQTIPAPANIQTPAGSQKIVQSSLVKAVTAPILNNISPDLTLEEGETKSITISLNKPAEIQETVSLTNSNPGAATISPIGPIIFEPGRQTSQPIQVTGVKQGNTQIIATLRNVPKSANVVVNPPSPPPLTSPGLVLPPSANGTVGLASAIQYPRAVAAPQGLVAVPRLLADKCAAVKDGQFSSFAQINRDSAPPQPGRYLSSPIVLEAEQVARAQEVMPEISFMVGPPKLLTVQPEAMVFTALGENCAR